MLSEVNYHRRLLPGIPMQNSHFSTAHSPYCNHMDTFYTINQNQSIPHLFLTLKMIFPCNYNKNPNSTPSMALSTSVISLPTSFLPWVQGFLPVSQTCSSPNFCFFSFLCLENSFPDLCVSGFSPIIHFSLLVSPPTEDSLVHPNSSSHYGQPRGAWQE